MVVYGSEPVVIIRIYVAYSGKGYFHVLNKNCWPVNLCGLRKGEHKFIGSDSYLIYGNKDRIQMLTFTSQDFYYTHNTSQHLLS